MGMSAMQKRERWRKGLVLSKHEIMEMAKARKKAQNDKDHDLDRRLRAIELVGKRLYTQVVAAEMLEVTASAVTRWVMKYRKHGIPGLNTKKAKGATPKLGKRQLERLKALILRGPENCGLDTGVWTGPTVQALIQKRFRVVYSTSQVRRILHKLGFSVQYPKKVLSEADAEEQQLWLLEQYPSIKKSRKRGRRRSV